mgnify:CR=1 FL=1
MKNLWIVRIELKSINHTVETILSKNTQWRVTQMNNLILKICFLGTVDAFTSLECEVVYQPTFSAPEETDFLIHVTGGSDLKLTCVAKVIIHWCTHTECQLISLICCFCSCSTRIVLKVHFNCAGLDLLPVYSQLFGRGSGD